MFKVIKKRFINRIAEFNNKKKNEFEKAFNSVIDEIDLTEENLYYLIYFAYAKAFKIDVKKLKIIFLDAYYGQNFNYVEKYFQNPKYIYLSRNPYDLFLSLRTYYYNQYLNCNNLNTIVKNVNLIH